MKKITTSIVVFAMLFCSSSVFSQIIYQESFESGAAGWTTDQGTGTTTSFELGAPAGTTINSASDGVNAWVTNLVGDYPINDDTRVTSPPIDATMATTDPVVSLDIWYESEFSWDGAVLQSSIDAGASWQNVGAFGDPDLNWYTDNSINGNPGGQQEGWTGRDSEGNGSGGWVTATHALDGLAGSTIQLRVAFGSDGSVTDEGFAFDNITVVVPNDPPVITCPGDIMADSQTGACGTVNVFFGEPSGIDPDGDMITYTQTMGPASGEFFPVGDTTVEWTADDGAGNMVTCQFIVTVTDIEAPTAVCQNITVELDAVTGTYTMNADEVDNGSSDPCGIASFEISVNGSPNAADFTFDCSMVGDQAVTLTITDVNGLTSTCDATVTVEDNTAPVIECIGEQVDVANTVSDMPGTAIPDNDPANPLVSVINVTEDVVISDLNIDVNISHTWIGDLSVTLTSPAGTTAVLVDRIGEPETGFGCNIDNMVVLFDDESANTAMTLEDSCTGGVTPAALPFADYQPVDAFSVFDGESSLGDWTITIADNASGDTGALDSWAVTYSTSIASAPLSLDLDAMGSVTVPASDLLLSAVDEACGFTVTVDGNADVTFTCENLGENMVEVTVTDDAGNVSTCTATVQINDVTAPVLVCQDVTVGVGEDGTVQLDPMDLLASSPGTFEVMVIGSDAAGAGGGGVDFTVAITEDAAISFDWAYTTVDDPGFDRFGYLLNGVFTSVIDEGVGDQSGSTMVNVVAGDTFGFRSETDDNLFGGNSTTITNFLPGFDGQFDPANWMLGLTGDSNGDAFIVEIPGGPLSFDACGIDTLGLDMFEFDCDDVGSTFTVTVFASDASGNLASCTSEVTIVDNLGPVFECPEDLSVDPGGEDLFYEVPDYWADGSIVVTDNCTDPVVDLTQDPAVGELLPDGVYTVTLTATDEFGNPSSCTFELTVESILGQDDNALDNAISLYPNPAQDKATISNGSNISLSTATIYDTNGRLINTIDLSDMQGEKTFDVSNLQAGVYLVQIQGETASTMRRLVKQ